MIKDLKKILTPADIVLIVILLIVSGIFLWGMNKNYRNKEVEIYYHNQLVKKCDLNQDELIEIAPGITAEIENGKVRMKESTCRNRYCVKQGWNDHFPIICVPNQVSIVIKSKKEEMLITR
ncbi:MAG: NusG domain II-containing protein [Candidatus Cloacimonetes bacterium]|nr:NusG domain II-containing protein [Candidatus Cloacimonadota bacterium]